MIHFNAVEEEARKSGYSVLIIQSSESRDVEAANLKLLKNNQIAGVFVAITGETDRYKFFFKIARSKKCR